MERRPIQSRNTRWAKSATRFLVRRGISPNTISLLSMLAAGAAGLVFYATSIATGPTQRALWFCGGILCLVRLLCNLFDGMVAVEQNITSPKGEFYNEVPDRVSDAVIFIGLGYSAGGDVVAGYAAALVAVFVAYVRTMATSVGAPSNFCGPMAKSQRMALVIAIAMVLALAPDAWRLPWGEAKMALGIVVVGGIVTAMRRLRQAVQHLEGIQK